MRKVILVNQYVTHLFVDIANVFADNGFHVVLLTGGIHSGNERLHANVTVKYLKKYNRNTSFTRIWCWALFALQVYWKSWFIKGNYIFSSNPPVFPLLLQFLRFFNNPYSVIIYDLYPDTLSKMDLVKEKDFVYRIWKKANQRFFLQANAIIGITTAISENILKYLPEGDFPKVNYFPIWGDHHHIKPVERKNNPFIKEYILEDFFIVLYSGNFGSTHSLDEIIQAADLLKNKKEVKFVLIGDGAKKKSIEKMVLEKGMDNVLILPWQPESQLKYTFSCADIGLVTLSRGIEQVSIPSKTFSYFSAGVPVIAISHEQSELAKILKDNDCGFQVNTGDPKALAKKILDLREDVKKLKLLSGNALKASLNYSDKNATKVYHFLVEKSH